MELDGDVLRREHGRLGSLGLLVPVRSCPRWRFVVRCTLLKGSTWSTERKYMRRFQGAFDIFFGVDNRMRKEEMEEQFNKEAKQGWILAADAARITDDKASSEDRKHTSGGAFFVVDSNLGAVIGQRR